MTTINRKTRPLLCPCSNSCKPLYNSLAADERITTGDLTEGYSGDCIGQGNMSEYVVGGQVHRNDMNHCVFTPLKGVIRFQINEGDVEGMPQQCQAVLYELHPRTCDSCGAQGRWIHWITTKDRRLCCRCYYTVNTEQGQTELIPESNLQTKRE